jgi:hypothetical protein
MGYFIAALFAYFRAKPVTHLVLACVFVGLAAWAYTHSIKIEQDKAAALAAPMPAPVSLSAFGDDDIHLADEINVIGQINPAYNYELTQERKGTDTVRYMYVMFGPDDAADTKVARAAVILTEEQLDPFTELMAANFVDFTEMGPVFSVNGAATSTPDLQSMAIDAMKKEGLSRSPDFVWIEPWIEGRAAALAPNDLDPLTLPGIVGAPAVLSVLLALFGMARGRRQTAAARTMAAAPIPAGLMGVSPAVAFGQTAPVAAPQPANPRAPMSQGKKIRIGILLGIVLLIVTKQFWVFALLPIAAVLFMNRDMRKIGTLTYDMIKAVIAKTADPVAAPAVTPAPPAPAVASSTAPVMSATVVPPAPKAAPKSLPPAIRSGFSFRDLLPKRREPEPQENPYASLAASIRDERLRRGGA